MLSIVYAFLCRVFFLAGFLSDPGSFPRALTAEEERECLLAYRNGDERQKNVLIEHNLRLVAHVVKKYASSRHEMDDLISIGTIGLIKAVNSFRCEKGRRLATYAARCIENEVLMVLRAEKKRRGEVSLYEPVRGGKGEGDLMLMDLLEAEGDSAFEDVELRGELQKLYAVMKRTLTEREQTVLRMRYGLGGGREATQREVASVLGLSRSYVSRIEKKAIGKLHAELTGSPSV